MASTVRNQIAFLVAACIGLSLAGCNDGGISTSTAGTTSTEGTTSTAGTTGAPTSGNNGVATGTISPASTLAISGAPAVSVVAGSAYRFLPAATDAGGASLTFSIQNQPKWSSFDSTTGLLTGTPAIANIGSYGQIVITASDGVVSKSLPAFSIAVTQAPASVAADTVTISGTPAASVAVGAAYSFQPAAKDANGNKLTFTVKNLPAWATFNASTGAITGTPTAANVGASAQITVSVGDGTANASLAPFVVTVTQDTVTAELSWMPPTTSTSGNTTELAGYHVYYGTSATSLSHVVNIDNAASTTYSVADLPHGTWYFAVTAYNTANVESGLSAVVPVSL